MKKRIIPLAALFVAASMLLASCGGGKAAETTAEQTEAATADPYAIPEATDPGEVTLSLVRDDDDGNSRIQLPRFELTGTSAAVDGLNAAIAAEVGAAVAAYESDPGLSATSDALECTAKLYESELYLLAAVSLRTRSGGDEGASVYCYGYDRARDRALTLGDALAVSGKNENDPSAAAQRAISEEFGEGAQLYECSTAASMPTPGGEGAIFFMYVGFTDDTGAYREEIFTYLTAGSDRGAVEKAVRGCDIGIWDSVEWQYPVQLALEIGESGFCRWTPERSLFSFLYPAFISTEVEYSAERGFFADIAGAMTTLLVCKVTDTGMDEALEAYSGDEKETLYDGTANEDPVTNALSASVAAEQGEESVSGESTTPAAAIEGDRVVRLTFLRENGIHYVVLREYTDGETAVTAVCEIVRAEEPQDGWRLAIVRE